MNSDINYIIQESLKGDKNYQEILLKRLNPVIYKNIYKYWRPGDSLIEDLLQEGYIVILESLKTYDKGRNVHFLYYIKIRLVYFYKNLFKKKLKDTCISIEGLAGGGKELNSRAKTEDIVILKDQISLMSKCKQELSETEQEILYLFYFDLLSIREISNKLHMTSRAVINKKSRTLKKLRKMMIKGYSNNLDFMLL